MNEEATLVKMCNERGYRYVIEFLCDDCGNRFYELYIFGKGHNSDIYTSDRSAQLDEGELRAQVIRRAIRGIKEDEE